MLSRFHRLIIVLSMLSVTLAIQPLSAQTQVELNTDDQKGLYALGLALAEITNRFRLSPAELDVVSAGLHDGVLKHPRLDLNSFREEIRKIGDFRALQTAREEKKLGQEFQQQVLKDPGAIRHSSGMISILQHEGTGESPSSTSKVKIKFVGSLRDGTEFDRTQEPITVPTSSAPFACLQEALAAMKAGEKVRIICPPELTSGFIHPRVPSGATLVFDLELIEVLASKAAVPSPSAKPVGNSETKGVGRD
ncbi:MAG TPA: FKBP-type peptidyl-prolyl cis-trans isomerase [Candidatus Angelobacter sp.]|jgi:FKBP-type peptidyl-prolyl cis-trans isomerase FkpA|nr:FKBP-type peptidyl-prolyl cis-trans isomerase [Candidatus Angelobacter sp.]